MEHILLLEDDIALGNGICLALQSPYLRISLYRTLAQAGEALEQGGFDLLILDVNLPDGSGLDLLRRVRRSSPVPIILLTANDMEMDIVTGLESGADDYITKPFNPLEVLARVRSQLRRYMQLGGNTVPAGALTIGGISLDDGSKDVTVDGEPVNLTPTEYEILKLLMNNPGRVFSPREMYKLIWKDEPYGAESTVAVHIRHLREKVEINPAEPRYIKAVWGQGYKIERGKEA